MKRHLRWTQGVILIITLNIFYSCSTASDSSSESNSQPHLNVNLIENTQLWRTATDTLGSLAEEGNSLITNGVAEVDFTIGIKTEEDTWTPWVELICDIEQTLKDVNQITISYKCDSDLLLKLSQKDFGEQGNETWAHYQYRFAPTTDWVEKTIDFSGFEQPDWAPEKALGIPLKLENTNAIYLVPDLDSSVGQSATLKVKKLKLK